MSPWKFVPNIFNMPFLIKALFFFVCWFVPVRSYASMFATDHASYLPSQWWSKQALVVMLHTTREWEVVTDTHTVMFEEVHHWKVLVNSYWYHNKYTLKCISSCLYVYWIDLCKKKEKLDCKILPPCRGACGYDAGIILGMKALSLCYLMLAW